MIYLDDILVVTRFLAQHKDILHVVFLVLQTHVLCINKKKSEFFKDRLEYYGHILSTDGIGVDLKKIEVIVGWPPPTTIFEVRSFLGSANSYHTNVHCF